MSSGLGLCKLCEIQDARYKCATCALPFCSLVCYKPHKEVHLEEQQQNLKDESQKPVDNEETLADSSRILDGVNREDEGGPEKGEAEGGKTQEKPPLDFSLLLKNEALITALRKHEKLKNDLLSINSVGLKTTFDKQNARISEMSNRRYQGQRGRGRGRGRGGGPPRTVDWTIERGTERSLRKLKGMRKGGREEDDEVEEFSQAVLDILGVYENDAHFQTQQTL